MRRYWQSPTLIPAQAPEGGGSAACVGGSGGAERGGGSRPVRTPDHESLTQIFLNNKPKGENTCRVASFYVVFIAYRSARRTDGAVVRVHADLSRRGGGAADAGSEQGSWLCHVLLRSQKETL